MRLIFVLNLAVFIVLAKKSKPHQNQQKPAVEVGRRMSVKIHYAGFCDTQPPDVELHNKTIVNFGTKSVVNAVMIFNRPVDTITKAISTIRRCESPEDEEDFCKHFHTLHFGKEGCDLMQMKRQLWSDYFQAIHPPLKCPIKEGIYKIENATLDLESVQGIFAAIPLEKYFWRTKVNAYDYKKFACIEFGLSFGRS